MAGLGRKPLFPYILTNKLNIVGFVLNPPFGP